MKQFSRKAMAPCLRWLLPALVVMLVMSACSPRDKIWNAGDLIEWVRSEAVKQGYQPDSIELEEWYREEGDQLIWYGRGIREGSNQESEFSIRVDEVWTPSSSG